MPQLTNAQITQIDQPDDFERFAQGLLDAAGERLAAINAQQTELDRQREHICAAQRPIKAALATYRRSRSRGRPATGAQTPTPAPTSQATALRDRLLELAGTEHSGALTASRAIGALEIEGAVPRGDRHSVYTALSDLTKRGRLIRIAPGRYRLPEPTEPTTIQGAA